MTHLAYDAWLVDLDGTLYHARRLKLVMALDLLIHPRAIRVVRAFRAEHEHLRRDAFQSAEVSPFDEQVARVAQATGMPHDEVRDTVMTWMVNRPSRWLRRFRRESLIRDLNSFRNNGGKTALVSDYPATHKLQALDAAWLFDVVVANGEPDGPDSLKPSASGLLKAATKLEVHPNRCLVVGDRDDADGQAARRAGMGFRLVG